MQCCAHRLGSQRQYLEARTQVYMLRRFLKRLLAACEDIAEGLRVAVHNWKEGGLYMNHNAVALAEAMADIRQGELDYASLIWNERLWVLE